MITSASTYLIPLAAYLLGSISAAIIACRLAGLPDPRTTGSKNPGATNVLRSGHKAAAAGTLIGDFLKGLLAVWLARWLQPEQQNLPAIAGAAAFLGHLYPVFFGFRGGKGVATALGAFIGINWISGLLGIATWLSISLSLRISSLAALVTFAALPAYIWLQTGNPVTTGIAAGISVLLFWRHRSNIRKLIHGEEPQVGEGH